MGDLLGEDFTVAHSHTLYRCLDKLEDFLTKIEEQYGKAERIWIMDRGIPTEDSLATMRAADTPVRYLVGTPKGQLSKLEKGPSPSLGRIRDRVDVKLLEQEGEIYILARSHGRMDKERAMRRRRLKRLCQRLAELQRQRLSRDELPLKLGAAKKEAGRAREVLRHPDGRRPFADHRRAHPHPQPLHRT